FECKNYKSKKVDKNDIIIFEEKINLANAQKGYFVAKNYTKDALNRASQSSRIEILHLDNENSRIFNKDYFIQIHGRYIENCNINMEVFPPIPFEKEFEFLPIQIPDTKLQTVHELVLEKLQLGNSKATKYRNLDDSHKGIDFQSEYEKVEILHFDKEKWKFMIALKEPILNNKKYVWIRFKID